MMADLGKPAPRFAAVRLRFKLAKYLLCLGAILLLAILFIAGWLLIAERFPKVVATTWGIIEKGCWSEVLYLREEQPLTAPAAGKLTIQVKNGARVPQGEILALLDQGAGLGRNVEVTNATRQSYRKYQTLVREETALTSDLRRIDIDLSKHFKKLGYQKTSPDLEALQQEKANITRSIEIIHAQSVSLRQTLAAVLNRWYFITAAEPGSFSTEYDGWEGSLQPESLSRLTLNDFTRKYPLKSGSSQVACGEMFGRLINPFNQMMAIKIIAPQTGIPSRGAIWRFKTVNGWKKASLTYVKMFNGRTGVAGVPLQAEDVDLTLPRLTKIFMVYQTVTGVTVPVQALFKKENLILVRVVKGAGYREKTVRVLGNDGNKAVVSGLKVGEMIISR
jgi:hypothetical protein